MPLNGMTSAAGNAGSANKVRGHASVSLETQRAARGFYNKIVILSSAGPLFPCQPAQKKKLIFLKKSVDFLGDSAILFAVMRDMYYVIDEDGLSRMFDVSHDGLEDAIEVANGIGTDVLRAKADPYEDDEVAWSFEDEATLASEPREDHFRSDAEADADALASAGFGTDEDYGCYDSGDDDYGCEW